MHENVCRITIGHPRRKHHPNTTSKPWTKHTSLQHVNNRQSQPHSSALYRSGWKAHLPTVNPVLVYIVIFLSSSRCDQGVISATSQTSQTYLTDVLENASGYWNMIGLQHLPIFNAILHPQNWFFDRISRVCTATWNIILGAARPSEYPKWNVDWMISG